VGIVTTRRVIEYHISRLGNKNPEVRLKAIKELELIGAVEALDRLASFRNDPDKDVRKAAQAAGPSFSTSRTQRPVTVARKPPGPTGRGLLFIT
jgi:hypothetical protein